MAVGSCLWLAKIGAHSEVQRYRHIAIQVPKHAGATRLAIGGAASTIYELDFVSITWNNASFEFAFCFLASRYAGEEPRCTVLMTSSSRCQSGDGAVLA